MLARGVSGRVRAARCAGIARRTLYYGPKEGPTVRPREDEPRVRRAIRRVALAHPTFGYRRVWAILRRRVGLEINRKRVRRLMKSEGLSRPAHLPRPRLPATGRLIAEVPNTRWYTDLTDVETSDRGTGLLMAILDGCTREVVSWEFFSQCTAADAVRVLEAAVAARFQTPRRPESLVLVTDQGSQFTARSFREAAVRFGVEHRMTRKRRPEDNGLQESFHGHLKADYLWLREPESFFATRVTVAAAIRDYNEERPHSSLDYQTPREFARLQAREASKT
ncbi:MAG: IS3 family transposase [Thermoplasmata archaeon]